MIGFVDINPGRLGHVEMVLGVLVASFGLPLFGD